MELQDLFFNLPLESSYKEIINAIKHSDNFTLSNIELAVDGINGKDFFIGSFYENKELEYKGYGNSFAVFKREEIFNVGEDIFKEKVILFSISVFFKGSEKQKFKQQFKILNCKFKKSSERIELKGYDTDIKKGKSYYYYLNKDDKMPFLLINKENSRTDLKEPIYTLNITYYKN